MILLQFHQKLIVDNVFGIERFLLLSRAENTTEHWILLVSKCMAEKIPANNDSIKSEKNIQR